MAYLDHIRHANNWRRDDFVPFIVAGQTVGRIRKDRHSILKAYPEIFQVNEAGMSLAPDLDCFEARSAAVSPMVETLASSGEITGFRGEQYPVMAEWGDTPLLQIERAACPWFGIRAWGVHINGFVRTQDGLRMWIARRAGDKLAYAGLLDNMVAGGQPIGIGLMENVIKECAEEAAIPASSASLAVATGLISYCHQDEGGLKPDQQFCFDLELPEQFEPRNTDGEVESFELLPIEDVARIVRETEEFKFNCNLVIIDFLIRHGLITAENEPDYAALCLGLRTAG